MKRPSERSWRSQGRLGDLHRGAGEGDGDGGAELYLCRLVRGYGERKERIVLGLAGPEAGEAKSLSGTGGVARAAQVAVLGPEARVQLHLWDEDELARGLAGLEVAVGLGCLRERVGATDANLEGVVAHPGEDALGAPQELLAGRGVPG